MKIWFSYLFGTQCFFSFFVKASAVGTAYSPSAVTTATVQAKYGPSIPLYAYLCALMDSTGQYVFAAARAFSTPGPYAFISNDYGQNYTQLTNTPNENYEYCAGTSDLTIIYILSYSNTLYKVTGGNVNADWTVLSPPSANYYGVATDTDTGTFVALVNYGGGRVVYSTDGGTQWSTSATGDLFYAIAASASGNIFHVVTNGVEANHGNYFSLDYGETLTPGDLPAQQQWVSVSCNAAGTLVVAVGTSVYLSENSGEHWNHLEVLTANLWIAAAISPNTNSNSQSTIIVSDGYGDAFSSNDSGQSWNQAQSLNGNGNVENSFALSSDGYYSVMGGAYMWYGQSYGENWCISRAGFTCNLVYPQSPTTIPTTSPSATPTAVPTASPSAIPTASPTRVPTYIPSAAPTAIPTAVPTASPSAIPTASPTRVPTYKPSAAPTASPSAVPTATPTYTPSSRPSSQPTMFPSSQPSSNPTGRPSVAPSSQPSNQPTSHPTQNNQHSALLTDGQIAGIIIGSVVAFLVLFTAIYYFLRKKPSKVVVENHDHIISSKPQSYEAVAVKDDRPLEL